MVDRSGSEATRRSIRRAAVVGVVVAVGVGLVCTTAFASVASPEARGWATAAGLSLTLAAAMSFSILLWALRERARLEARHSELLDSKEREFRRVYESLLQSNRELERYASIAAHDLQEPLRSILAFSDLLARRHGHELSPEARNHLARISQAGLRMRALITDLLEYSRLDAVTDRTEHVNLREAVDAAVGDLAALIEQTDATIDVGPLPTVPGNRRELIGLFSNLLSNALKYRSPDRKPVVKIRARRRDGEWLIGVKDNGIGIEPEYHERVFELFRRLDRSKDDTGTGLGLAICQRTVSHHGGRIWVESTPGEGSTFFFTLPAEPVRVFAGPLAPSTEPPDRR